MNVSSTNTTTLIRFASSDQNLDLDAPVYTPLPSGRRSTAKTYSEPVHTRIEKRRKRTRTFAEDPFRARYGQRAAWSGRSSSAPTRPRRSAWIT